MDPKKKKETIDYILNECGYCDETDRERLEAMPDEKLTKWQAGLVANVAKDAKADEMQKALKKGVTDPGGNTHTWNEEKGEWQMKAKEKEKKEPVANESDKLTITPEQQEDLAFASQVRQERRDEAITKITANESNKLTEEQLAKMPLDVLQAVANSTPDKKPPTANWAGAAGAGAGAGGGKDPEDGFAPFGQPGEYIPEEKTETAGV